MSDVFRAVCRMNVADYMKQHAPRGKRSGLLALREPILEMRACGYAYVQVCEWLAVNGVTASPETVRKFVRKHSVETASAEGAASPARPAAPPQPSPSSSPPSSAPALDDLDGLDPRQRRERIAERFIPRTGIQPNSLVERILKQSSSS